MPIREVTKSALCQARRKFRFEAFCELNQHLLSFVKQNSSLRTWHGFRLLAIDGSTIQIPCAAKSHFDPNTAENCQPLAQSSHLFDLLNHLTIHALLHPYRVGERELALQHGPYLQANDLLLLDRGYPGFWFFAWILSHSAHFCARASLTSWKEVKQFFDSGEKEQIVTLHPTYEALQKCRLYGIPTTPICVRLVRISCPGAEDSILITSLLDSQLYPLSLFSDLYHLRWGIEEHFKAMKSRMEIENFTGKSVESVYQDFHAKILTLNIAAVLIRPVQEQLDREEPCRRQINFTYALSCMKDTIVRLFQRDHIHDLLWDLFDLFRRTTEPVRPHRSFPRKKVVRDRPAYFPCYKPTA